MERTDVPSNAPASGPPRDPAAELARALRSGRDVLGAWYRAEFPRVHRLCQGFLASRSEADDVAQDAMLRLADHLERWDPGRPYAAWRNQVVVNVCRDRQRSIARRGEHETRREAPAAPSLDPADIAAANEVSALVDRSLGVLPPREREIFVLIDLEGFDSAEAAEQLGIAASTVRAALSFARRRMRDLLAPMLDEGDRAR